MITTSTLRGRIFAVCAFALMLASSAQAQFVPAIPRSGLYPFFNTSDPDPSLWTGYEIEILDWMCSKSQGLGDGEGNSPIVNCVPKDEWFVGTFDDVFKALENGTVDFAMGSISRSDQREELYNFVKPFYYSSAAVLYVLDANSDVTFETLRGQPVCAVRDYYLNSNNALRDVFGASRVVSLASSMEAVAALQNGDCIAMVGGDIGRFYAQKVGLSVVGNRVSEQPLGIITRKDGPQELVDDLSFGLVSMMWAGNDSTILQYENDTLIANGYPKNENLQRLVSAVTGMSTENGLALRWASTTPVFGGGESVNASGAPSDVTILMYQGSPLPLASLQGEETFLEEGSTWSGMEVQIAKAICASSYFNCLEVLVTDNVDDRLSYLDQGIANISLGSIDVTQDRLDKYSFVQPMYFSAGPAIYVNQTVSVQEPEPGLEYAAGKTLCTLNGSAYNAQAEAKGATLVYYNTSQAAIQGLSSGDCDGLLWDSSVSFEEEGLVQASSDMSEALPIGIAVAPSVPYEVYSAISSIMVNLLDGFPESDIIRWLNEYAAGSVPNPQVSATSQSISDFGVERVALDGRVVESGATLAGWVAATWLILLCLGL
jgi:ABC-type amino acid transport substrate-binding protein